MDKIDEHFGSVTVTFENVNEAQVIAMKKLFEYWQLLGERGSSRPTTLFADGDGNFRPKVTIDCDMDLPEIDNDVLGCVKPSGEFKIDHDSIAWKIYK